jgi:predicted YcjX-like family ATPase
LSAFDNAFGLLSMRRTIRVGVTGLAESGKTSLLTSVAANLLALGAQFSVLPSFSARLAGRTISVAVSPSGAETMPRFDYPSKLANLRADPPRWPDRTIGTSLLALDIDITRGSLASVLPPQRLRLEFLDYPGEWLLDVPLLGTGFPAWSRVTLERLSSGPAARYSQSFLAFVEALPPHAPGDEMLAKTGHGLFRSTLRALRTELGLPMLQPGRFLMKPREEPPWMEFFPLQGNSPLMHLMERRFDKYREAVRRDLIAPSFGRVDRLVVLANVLGALHSGPEVFAETRAALDVVSAALRFRPSSLLPEWMAALVPGWMLPDWLTSLIGGIHTVAYVATKSDHVADRQRGNLAALMGQLVAAPPRSGFSSRSFALSSVRCTEDIIWTLDGRPVSAVRGRIKGHDKPARSYPGEVPDRIPDKTFWDYPFLALPDFEPRRLPEGGKGGVPHINLDKLLTFLLEDVLP